MTNSEVISLFAYIVLFITTLAGWIFTYRSQRKTQQTIAKLEEHMQDMMGHMPKDDAPKYSDSSMLWLSADELKDLALWYDRAKQWFVKGKGNAVDWQNKHLREEVAAPIRLKLAGAKNELDIMHAFNLRNAKLASDGEISDSIMLLLSTDEMKDLALWYSKARAWFLKGKGCAVDWENKHLREEIALPIRQKLADAKNEMDIMNAFDLGNAKPPSDGEV